MKNIRLGDVLIEFGYITPDQLNTALAYQKEHRDLRVGQALQELGYVNERQVLEALAQRLQLTMIDIEHTNVDVTAVEKVPQELAQKYDMPILYSCHPRSKNRLEKSGFKLDPRVRVNEPLGFNDYNKLQMNALAIVSDSGTLPEESSFYLSIGHPIAAVCIRTSTERPEALEAGDFILAGITTKELLNATDMAIEMKQKGVLGKPCPDYVDETVSMKVVRIIQGYVNVVNKMVWRKDQ